MAGWNMSRWRSTASLLLVVGWMGGIAVVRADGEPAGSGPEIVAGSFGEPTDRAVEDRDPEAVGDAEPEANPDEPDAPPEPEEPAAASASAPESTVEPTDTALEDSRESIVGSAPSHRIRIKLDATGEIFAPAGRDVPPVRRPIAVDARFDFVQTDSAAADRGVIRRYRDAAADVKVEDAVRAARLPTDARTLRVAIVGATPTPSLDTGFLTREELDLLETPFDPLLLDRLLPKV